MTSWPQAYHSLKRAESGHRVGGALDGDEDVIVVRGGDDVAAHARVAERGREGRGEPDGLEVGVDGEGDPGGAKEDR